MELATWNSSLRQWTRRFTREYSKKNLRSSARKLSLGRRFIFQQDSDPKHTAKTTQSWFASNKIEVLPWAPQSPDLNPIEHLWQHLEIKLRKRPVAPRNLTELKAALQEEWDSIDPDMTKSLVDSMSRRCQAVIAAKGGNTKY